MSSSNSDKKETSLFWPETAIDWLELMLKTILITASLGAVYQYFDVKQESRVKETMDFLDNFSSGDLQSAQLNLSEFWENYHDKIKLLNQATVANEESRALILERIVLPGISHNNQQKDIDLLVSFFGNIHTCVANRICDKQTASVFFSEYATSFFALYEPWIKQRREIIPSYACQLQAFVEQGQCEQTNLESDKNQTY